MSINKIVLSIALTVSFQNAIISMEDNSNEEIELEQLNDAAGAASFITNFVRKSSYNPEHMESLGRWLYVKRKKVTEDAAWDEVINDLINNVPYCRRHCVGNNMTTAVCKVVIEIAQDLQPGQDCSDLLTESAQEAIEITTHEWNATQAKKKSLEW